MEQHNGHVHIDEEEASGGSKEGVVRWVLLGGLVLVIALLSVTWIVGAASQGDVEEEATVSGKIQSMEEDGSDTDSVVTQAPAEERTTTEDGIQVIEN